MIQYSFEDGRDRIAAIGFSAIRKTIPGYVLKDLFNRQLFDDLVQEIYLLSISLNEDKRSKKKIYRYFAKGIYKFLKEEGYRRKGSSYSHDFCFSEVGM